MRSWPLVASWDPHAELRHREGRRRLDTGTRNSAEVAHFRREDVRLCAQVGNGEVDFAAGALQDTAAADAGCFGLAGDRIVTMMVVVVGVLRQAFEKRLQVEDRNNARIQQSVLVDELGNGVLTWEEMDSFAAQAGWD